MAEKKKKVVKAKPKAKVVKKTASKGKKSTSKHQRVLTAEGAKRRIRLKMEKKGKKK